MVPSARFESLHHVSIVQEGYGEGWRDHSTRHHQGHDTKDEQQGDMIDTGRWWYGCLKGKQAF